MKRANYLTLGLLVFALGCQTNLKLSNQQKDSISQDVQETSQQFWALYNRTYDSGSLPKLLSFFDENCIQIWQTEPAAVIFNVTMVKTPADLEKVWKEMLELRSSTNVTMLDDYFTVLSKDKVLEVNEGDFTITGKDGKTFGPYRMVNSIIWGNNNGAWKMLHFHESWKNYKE
jgi:hypothetical protein